MSASGAGKHSGWTAMSHQVFTLHTGKAGSPEIRVAPHLQCCSEVLKRVRTPKNQQSLKHRITMRVSLEDL